MAGKDWQIEGRYAEYCSCDYGCPCETMAEPTFGHCTGLVAFKIDRGHCEDVPQRHPPLSIVDVRRARVAIGDHLRAESEPIRNPVTDAEHQMLTVLPNGWVFHEAENASGNAKSTGTIRFDLNHRHSSLAHVAWNQNGLVYKYDEYKQKFGRP